MYPNLFGIPDGSYIIMILLGIIVALVILIFYLKKIKLEKNQIIDLSITSIIAIIFGIIFAVLFQNLYNFIEAPWSYKWSWSMTFFGGLIGGTLAFLGSYFFFYKKSNPPLLDKILSIAPACLCIAHGFGRIGCFMAGCCYGIESTGWYSMYFPALGKSVIPTQLYESIFLFLLGSILLIICFKKNTFPINACIYMICYGFFRFLIEFIRGDHRGSFIIGLTPSQFWSILLFLSGLILLFIFIRHNPFKQKEKGSMQRQ